MDRTTEKQRKNLDKLYKYLTKNKKYVIIFIDRLLYEINGGYVMLGRLQGLNAIEELYRMELDDVCNKIAELKGLIFLSKDDLGSTSSREEQYYLSVCIHNFERQLKDLEIDHANCQKELREIKEEIKNLQKLNN